MAYLSFSRRFSLPRLDIASAVSPPKIVARVETVTSPIVRVCHPETSATIIHFPTHVEHGEEHHESHRSGTGTVGLLPEHEVPPPSTHHEHHETHHKHHEEHRVHGHVPHREMHREVQHHPHVRVFTSLGSPVRTGREVTESFLKKVEKVEEAQHREEKKHEESSSSSLGEAIVRVWGHEHEREVLTESELVNEMRKTAAELTAKNIEKKHEPTHVSEREIEQLKRKFEMDLESGTVPQPPRSPDELVAYVEALVDYVKLHRDKIKNADKIIRLLSELKDKIEKAASTRAGERTLSETDIGEELHNIAILVNCEVGSLRYRIVKETDSGYIVYDEKTGTYILIPKIAKEEASREYTRLEHVGHPVPHIYKETRPSYTTAESNVAARNVKSLVESFRKLEELKIETARERAEEWYRRQLKKIEEETGIENIRVEKDGTIVVTYRYYGREVRIYLRKVGDKYVPFVRNALGNYEPLSEDVARSFVESLRKYISEVRKINTEVYKVFARNLERELSSIGLKVKVTEHGGKISISVSNARLKISPVPLVGNVEETLENAVKIVGKIANVSEKLRTEAEKVCERVLEQVRKLEKAGVLDTLSGGELDRLMSEVSQAMTLAASAGLDKYVRELSSIYMRLFGRWIGLETEAARLGKSWKELFELSSAVPAAQTGLYFESLFGKLVKNVSDLLSEIAPQFGKVVKDIGESILRNYRENLKHFEISVAVLETVKERQHGLPTSAYVGSFVGGLLSGIPAAAEGALQIVGAGAALLGKVLNVKQLEEAGRFLISPSPKLSLAYERYEDLLKLFQVDVPLLGKITISPADIGQVLQPDFLLSLPELAEAASRALAGLARRVGSETAVDLFKSLSSRLAEIAEKTAPVARELSRLYLDVQLFEKTIESLKDLVGAVRRTARRLLQREITVTLPDAVKIGREIANVLRRELGPEALVPVRVEVPELRLEKTGEGAVVKLGTRRIVLPRAIADLAGELARRLNVLARELAEKFRSLGLLGVAVSKVGDHVIAFPISERGIVHIGDKYLRELSNMLHIDVDRLLQEAERNVIAVVTSRGVLLGSQFYRDVEHIIRCGRDIVKTILSTLLSEETATVDLVLRRALAKVSREICDIVSRIADMAVAGRDVRTIARLVDDRLGRLEHEFENIVPVRDLISSVREEVKRLAESGLPLGRFVSSVRDLLETLEQVVDRELRRIVEHPEHLLSYRLAVPELEKAARGIVELRARSVKLPELEMTVRELYIGLFPSGEIELRHVTASTGEHAVLKITNTVELEPHVYGLEEHRLELLRDRLGRVVRREIRTLRGLDLGRLLTDVIDYVVRNVKVFREVGEESAIRIESPLFNARISIERLEEPEKVLRELFGLEHAREVEKVKIGDREIIVREGDRIPQIVKHGDEYVIEFPDGTTGIVREVTSDGKLVIDIGGREVEAYVARSGVGVDLVVKVGDRYVTFPVKIIDHDLLSRVLRQGVIERAGREAGAVIRRELERAIEEEVSRSLEQLLEEERRELENVHVEAKKIEVKIPEPERARIIENLARLIKDLERLGSAVIEIAAAGRDLGELFEIAQLIQSMLEEVLGEKLRVLIRSEGDKVRIVIVSEHVTNVGAPVPPSFIRPIVEAVRRTVAKVFNVPIEDVNVTVEYSSGTGGGSPSVGNVQIPELTLDVYVSGVELPRPITLTIGGMRIVIRGGEAERRHGKHRRHASGRAVTVAEGAALGEALRRVQQVAYLAI